MLASGKSKQQTEEEVGTAGRWRVGANLSVRKEEETGSPEDLALARSCPGIQHRAVQVALSPQRPPDAGTGGTRLLQNESRWTGAQGGLGKPRWGDSQAGGRCCVFAVGKVGCRDD